jgi:hypothetical protein
MAMVDQEIKRAIEACRPGSDDVSLPEMSQLAEAVGSDADLRELLERSQRCDAAIGAAFRDVPVPDGLSERLLAAVGQTEPQVSKSPAPAITSEPANGDSAEPDVGAVRPRSRYRRLHITAGLATALALSVLVTVVVIHHSGNNEPVANDQLRQDVSAWESQVVRRGWKKDFTEPKLDERPLASAINAVPQRWCQIKTQYDQSTIVYDLAPGERMAFLFCMHVKTRDSKLPKAPPVKPYATTGRMCIGAWRCGDLVYVLAVEGEARYNRLRGSSILIGLVASAPLPLS